MIRIVDRPELHRRGAPSDDANILADAVRDPLPAGRLAEEPAAAAAAALRGVRMSTPKRIQRKRTKGWRMPPDAIYVGRPGPWGNQFVVGGRERRSPDEAVQLFGGFVATARAERGDVAVAKWLAPLRGHDLACFCRLDQPCHADVLLELANA